VLGVEVVAVRRDVAPIHVPIDRERLSRLPGWPAACVPLLCLDTETTGLATAAGTVAFLVGVGRWRNDAGCCLGFLLWDRPLRRQKSRAHRIGGHVEKLPQELCGNIETNAEPFNQAFVTLCPPDQRRVSTFGKARSAIVGERVGNVEVTSPHQRIGQRLAEGRSCRNRQ